MPKSAIMQQHIENRYLFSQLWIWRSIASSAAKRIQAKKRILYVFCLTIFYFILCWTQTKSGRQCHLSFKV